MLTQSTRQPDVAAFATGAEPELIEAVRAIRPLLSEEAPGGQARGWLTERALAALDAVPGLWPIIVPQRLGGTGLSALGMLRVGAELATGDPSAAWVVQILGGATWVASLLSDAIQDELFAGGLPRVCSVMATPGRARAVPGGYRISGVWPYCSGFRHARWGIFAVMLESADGALAPGHMAILPTSEMSVVQPWRTVGLQGTGSDTVGASDVFIPHHRLVTADAPPGSPVGRARHCGAPSDAWPLTPLVGRTGMGQAVGAAEAMLEIFLDGADKRAYTPTLFATRAQSQVVQHAIGEAAVSIGIARAVLEAAAGELDAVALTGAKLSLEERARSKAQAAYAMKLIETAAQTIIAHAGSSALQAGHPLARYAQDLAMLARHTQNSTAIGFEIYGRALLGIAPSVMPDHLI